METHKFAAKNHSFLGEHALREQKLLETRAKPESISGYRWNG
jgi:hypothetical protein